MAEGIETRHSRGCASRQDERCNCEPSYQAHVWSKKDNRRIRKTFPTLAAARSWRTDAKKELKDGTMRAPTAETLRAFADVWLEGAEAGTILSRRRTPYAPATLRGYRRDFEVYIYPDFGALKLSDFSRFEAQDLIDRLISKGWSGSKVRNVITPLQALYRYAKQRGKATVDPTDDLELPAAGGTLEWEGTPEDVRALLDALPESDRALWATAAYAGLRRGELRALRVENIRDDGISVEHSWDDVEGEKAPKSKAGVRVALLPETLREILLKQTAGRTGDALVFGRTDSEPFTPSYIRKRAESSSTLQQLRHACRSFLGDAGIPEERCDRYMGHSSSKVGRRYSHALRGQRLEDAARLESYLNREAAIVVTLPTARQLRDSERQSEAVSSGFER
ncbi:MAG TPA: tyrosine-type recombinase/integrase [Gaiellaceae bacterium]